jgi:non-ribosomal peptide synthase protein (TIGR01720 family)
MLQVLWFDAGPETPGRLQLIGNHLVVDGVSWRLLVPDLAEAYTSLAAGREVALQPVPTSYRHWARALAAEATSPGRRAELADWVRSADDAAPLFESGAGAPGQASVTLPAEVTTALLTTVPAAFHAGVEDILLTGFAAAIAAWRRRRGQDAAGVLVDLEGHGRVPLGEGTELSRTVGWFTNAYPVRLDVGAADLADVRAGGEAADRAVKRIKEQLRAVPGDGLGYGLLRYLNPETAPQLAGLSRAQIGFNYLGRFGAQADGPARDKPDRMHDWQTAPEGGGGGSSDLPAQHPLEVMGLVRDLPGAPELSLTIAWSRDSVAEPAVRELLDSWSAMLTGLARHTSNAGGGGHTPSDFPLVEIDQSELDEFEATAQQLEEEA